MGDYHEQLAVKAVCEHARERRQNDERDASGGAGNPHGQRGSQFFEHEPGQRNPVDRIADTTYNLRPQYVAKVAVRQDG